MPTEWLRVMLAEVERKRREEAAARTEAERRTAPRAKVAVPPPRPQAR